jgi:ABC-type multidrug transport system fused ATPase/permease subunit
VQQLSDSGPFVSQLLSTGDRFEAPTGLLGAHDRVFPASSTLQLRDVNYAYDGGEQVLFDIDLELQERQVLGIVGPSGSGKSTLVQILLGLRRPTSGQVLVGGVAQETIAADEWSRSVSFVPQVNSLIRGTVSENIRFYRSRLTESEIVDCAMRAHVHDEIMELPHGYETQLGPGSRDLSGGQLQRLGIARALAGSPTILVLDEPTSALDLRTEERIRQTLLHLQGSVSIVIVAHRLSTLRLCDEVAVLRDGRLVNRGPHQELLAKDQFYTEAVRISVETPQSLRPPEVRE